MEGWAPLNIPGIKSNMLLQALGYDSQSMIVRRTVTEPPGFFSIFIYFYFIWIFR